MYIVRGWCIFSEGVYLVRRWCVYSEGMGNEGLANGDLPRRALCLMTWGKAPESLLTVFKETITIAS